MMIDGDRSLMWSIDRSIARLGEHHHVEDHRALGLGVREVDVAQHALDPGVGAHLVR